MANLPKLTLSYDEQKGDWTLKKDLTGRTLRRFETKTEARKGGVLEKVLGEVGGSVRIQKQNGVYQEERTYPGNKDPRKSPG
jgi:hypothetical protein